MVQCVVAPKGVRVEVMAEGPIVAAAEGFAEVGAVESAAAAGVGEVVADVVVVDYRRS